jgi:ATP-dependent DNA ligase
VRVPICVCAPDNPRFVSRLAYGIIAAVRMPFAPMLAMNHVSLPLAGEWVLEPKFDGWRAIVAVGQDVRVWTRTGHELTERLPELAPLVDCCGGASVVLDGELVAGQGRAADFYGLLPRVAARRRSEPLTFVAFDVLAFDGPVIDQPYCQAVVIASSTPCTSCGRTLRTARRPIFGIT